jgi:hypothetical protein
MESNIDPTTQYTQITVDVPQDRVAEFHAFFRRFIAWTGGRRPRGRHGRYGRSIRGHHGRGCARGHRSAQREPSSEATTL